MASWTNLRFYAVDPATLFATLPGDDTTYSGPGDPEGLTTITDNEAGAGGAILDGAAGGEQASADVYVGGLTSTGTTVSAGAVWTLRDAVTGQSFEIVEYRVADGPAAGSYLLSEQPLVAGRTYETQSYTADPDADAGDPALAYADYAEDNTDGVVEGTAGDDTIGPGYGGDPDGDVIDGGDSPQAETTSTVFSWADAGTDDQDISGGLSHDAGGIRVDVSFDLDATSRMPRIDESLTHFTATGESFDTSSALFLSGTHQGADTTTARIDFSATAASGFDQEVQNVTFRINDIDQNAWTDVVSVRAYDADGNPAAVRIELQSNSTDTVTGDTVTAGGGAHAVSDAEGSALIDIAGPVSRIEIEYGNAQIAQQVIYVTDLHFDAVTRGDEDLVRAGDGNDVIASGLASDTVHGEGGDDTVSGGADDDLLYGGDGADSLDGGAGDDALHGDAGDDRLTGGTGFDSLYGGTGSDRIEVSEDDELSLAMGGEDGDGGDADVLALSGTGGVEVTFTGDEAGTFDFAGTAGAGFFGEIERIETTEGDDVVDGSAATEGLHISTGAGDDSIVGGSGDDVILFGEGVDTVSGGDGDDTIDDISGARHVGQSHLYGGAGNDDIWSGDGDDTVYGGTGNDTIGSEGGNDTVYGGDGDDVILDDSGDDVIEGGIGRDSIEAGSGNDRITFAEGDTVHGGDGDDLFVLADYGETGAADITVTGGEGGETDGDTLQLGTFADLETLTYTNTDDVNGGNSGFVMLRDGSRLTFSEIETVICFTPGTRLATPHGPRAVETLAIGDRVVTRDHGLQPIRWIGRRTVRAEGRLAPVRIAAGTLAGQERDLLVSPRHRVLVQGYRSELLFGESEVLAAATHLVGAPGVTERSGGEVTYLHILFDEHEIVFAEGAPAESFHPGAVGLGAVDAAAREELFMLFPGLRADPTAYGRAARRCLKRHEAELLQG